MEFNLEVWRATDLQKFWALQGAVVEMFILKKSVYFKKKCDRILENHPYGRKWHSKYLLLKSSIQHWISTHLWLQEIINTQNYK